MSLTRTAIRLVVALALAGLTTTAHCEELRLCFWNVESGGAKNTVNANRIKDEQGIDLWGLSEVKDASDASKYQLAAQAGESGNFQSIASCASSFVRVEPLQGTSRVGAVAQGTLPLVATRLLPELTTDD